jgi:hypothetical protein
MRRIHFHPMNQAAQNMHLMGSRQNGGRWLNAPSQEIKLFFFNISFMFYSNIQAFAKIINKYYINNNTYCNNNIFYHSFNPSLVIFITLIFVVLLYTINPI